MAVSRMFCLVGTTLFLLTLVSTVRGDFQSPFNDTSCGESCELIKNKTACEAKAGMAKVLCLGTDRLCDCNGDPPYARSTMQILNNLNEDAGKIIFWACFGSALVFLQIGCCIGCCCGCVARLFKIKKSQKATPNMPTAQPTPSVAQPSGGPSVVPSTTGSI